VAKTTERTLGEAKAGVTVTMSTVPSKTTSEIVLLPGIRRKTTNDE
jgi:hypothetical protein